MGMDEGRIVEPFLLVLVLRLKVYLYECLRWIPWISVHWGF